MHTRQGSDIRLSRIYAYNGYRRENWSKIPTSKKQVLDIQPLINMFLYRITSVFNT